MARVFADLASETCEATVLLTDDEEIRSLNQSFRGIDEPTDVLSFAYQEAVDAEVTPDLLGDIVISVDTAMRYVDSGAHVRRLNEHVGSDDGVDPGTGSAGSLAAEAEWSLLDELSFLLIHGALHLVGHDHGEPTEERAMRAEEQRLWALVSVA